MVVSKYDRDELKVQFFKSEFQEVKAWWESINNTYSPYITESTKGWTSEKKGWKTAMAELAMKEAEREFIETYKPDIKVLGNYHKLIMGIVGKKLMHIARRGKKLVPKLDGDFNEVKDEKGNVILHEIDDTELIDSGEVEKLRKMIKVEKNEPISVTKNSSDVKVIPITDEDKQKVETLLDANV